MSAKIGSTAVVFTGTVDPLQQAIRGSVKSLQDYRRQADQLAKPVKLANPLPTAGADLRADPAVAHMKQVQRQAATTRSSLLDLRRVVAGGVAAGGAMAAAGAGLNLAGGLAEAVGESVQLAAEFEKTSLAFEVMLGSAERAGQVIADLRRFGADSPFNFAGLADTAKQLSAAGVSGDQLVPVLRTLGDVAVGDQEKLNRLAYAYGQVRSAGRLYGTELRQFSETGVPLREALGRVKGVDAAQVPGLVEAGQVDFRDVVSAFKDLTREGGQFFGLTEKYGQTFAGTVERLKDGVEVLKREFGQALIDELGLKDATRDLGMFTDRVRRGVDDLRPAIRLVGDLGRAAVQVGSELARAGAVFMRVRLDGFAAAIPELRQLPDIISRAVRELQDFRIDPATAAELAIVTGEGLLKGMSLAWAGLKEIGQEADRYLIQPFLKAAASVAQAADEIAGVILEAKSLRAAAGDVRPGRLLAPGGILTEVAAAEGRRQSVLAGGPRPGRLSDRVADALNVDIVARYGDPRRGADFHEPRAARFAAAGAMSWLQPEDYRAPTGVGALDRIDDWKSDVRRWAESLRQSQDVQRKQDDAVRAASVAVDKFAGAAGLVGGAFDAVNRSARLAADTLGRLAGEAANQQLAAPAVAGGGLMGVVEATRQNSTFRAALDAGTGPSGALIARAAELNKQHEDPMIRLRRQADELRTMKDAGLISDRVAGLAFRDNVQEATREFNPETRLPSAAEAGSQEAARLVQMATAGTETNPLVTLQTTANTLLAELARIGLEQLGAVRQKPPVVKLP